jgi:hypothetical protein
MKFGMKIVITESILKQSCAVKRLNDSASRTVGRSDILLLALASTYIFGSVFRETHDHIFVSRAFGVLIK